MAILEKNSRWQKAWIEPWWVSHRDLPYVNEPFNDPGSLAQWQALGYTQSKFTGDMYDMRNPEPAWIEGFRYHFPWQHFSWSVYRMGPGTVLPEHQDTYARFREIYGITDPNTIYRAIVFLEPWSSGHYFEVEGCPVTGWLAGDTYIWHNDVLHLAANVGRTQRYTLQITGVPDAHLFVE